MRTCSSTPCSEWLHEPSHRQGRDGRLGSAVAAFATCCAGPIVSFLAAANLLTVAGIAVLGVAGLAVLVPATV